MWKKNKRDKQLLENLERILKGQDTEDSSSMDDETRAALDLVRKMMNMREAPSKEYAQKLKAQLIHQLAQQEKKEGSRKQDFGWEFPRITAWQATVSAALVVIVAACVFLVLNNIGFQSTLEETSPSTTVTGTTIIPSTKAETSAPSETTKPSTTTNILIAQAVVDKLVYTAGEYVNIQIAIKSDYSHPVVLDQFPPVVNIKHIESGKMQTLPSVLLTNITIEPGRTKIFNIDWDTQNVTAGNYTIELGELYSYVAPLKIKFTSPVFSIVSPN